MVLPACPTNGPQHPLYIDAFGGGVIKSTDEMVAWLRDMNFHDAVQPQWFESCPSSEVWARMLRNLVGIAQRGATLYTIHLILGLTFGLHRGLFLD